MSDLIKEAFTKVKEDISTLKESLLSISNELSELKKLLPIQPLNSSYKPTNQPTQNRSSIPTEAPTHIPTQNLFQQTNSTQIPTHNLTVLSKTPLKTLKSPYKDISTGNEGVPTNQQTNQQTNQHIFQHTGNEGVRIQSTFSAVSDNIQNIDKISEVLFSLDSIKKEVRFKFKKLTSQEMAVFSAIYTLEEKGLIVDYSLLSKTLNLTEISIRDYIRKLNSKGIPISKIKENNKKITLSINSDLKKITSLQTIKMLREI